jgi:hypothetical protein
MVALLIFPPELSGDDGQLLVRASPASLQPNFLQAGIGQTADEVVNLL